MRQRTPLPLYPLPNYSIQTSWLSVKTPLLLMRALVEDESDGCRGSIPGRLEHLVLEPSLICAVVPLSQV